MKAPFQNIYPAARLLILLGFWIFIAVGFSQIAYFTIAPLFGVENPDNVIKGVITNTAEANAFLYTTLLASSAGFFFSALLMAVLESGYPAYYLGLTVSPGAKKYLLAVASIFIAQFFIGFLVDVNKQIPLPGSLSNLRQTQDQLLGTINVLLDFKNPLRLVLVTLCMAVAPAVAEEFFFRGIIMGNLIKTRMPAWVAIVLSGLFFAIVHFEFDNTLAIWALGMYLGFLYYVSGSLWLAIAAHFTNNFLAVLLAYLYHAGYIGKDVADSAAPWYLVALSFALFAGCIFMFKQWKAKENVSTTDYNSNPTQL